MGRKSGSKNFYAYYLVDSDTRGIVTSWSDCESAIAGHHSRCRGFATRLEATAWLDAGAVYDDRKAVKRARQEELPEDAVFFDAGTGRGLGTEVNVTDRQGVPLAFMAAPQEHLTEHGTVLLSVGRTNNYGELMGCYLALKIAAATGRKVICGDSRLVIDFWSNGRISADAAADPDLKKLAARTAELRRVFERSGGRIVHIPGGINPADLGFHRD